MTEREFDLIVVGAGAVGENLADRAVQGGLSVAVVEAELVGGECSYWACMPTKALLRPGSALRAARRVPGAREAFGGPLDATQALRFRDGATSSWSDAGQVSWLEGAGIELVRGHATLDGERRVRVTTAAGETSTLVARSAVALCTGSAALIPDIPGLSEASPWTNREAAAAQRAPNRLVVIGAGVVAAEFATAFSSLGSAVTMLVRGGTLLGGNEPFAGELVAQALREAGVGIRTHTEATSVRRAEDGVHLTLTDGEEIVADEVLVATGRRPRTEALGLETIGLEPGAALSTDDTLRVLGADGGPIDWLYAAGDAAGRALLTHQGKYQARAAGDVIAARATGGDVDDAPWGRHVATADHAAVPQVVFTDPEVAAVGLTEQQARDAGIPTRAVEYDMSWLAGATVHAEGYVGRAKLVIDTERDVVVGATFAGADVAELLSSATIAVVGEVPIHRLWHAVPAYPTLGEVWLRLLEELGRDTALSS
jgi:pyruvate/2-oxoglutarate dehydrogenase complex dihydrolipoamide dehydrogenase (E3) component